jgi:DNA-binding PadR family transcriptional regulator
MSDAHIDMKDEFTMYELIILSLLMYSPLHGYLIAKITNDMIGPWAKVSNGTLYPLLAKLEKMGLIAVVSPAQEHEQERDRQSRSFVITELGRKRFHHIMMDTTSNPGEYQKFFRLKVPCMQLLQPSERLYLYDHYINYCQTHVLHMKAEANDMIEESAGQDYMPPRRLEGILEVLNRLREEWQAEMNWALHLRQQEVTHIEDDKQEYKDVESTG